VAKDWEEGDKLKALLEEAAHTYFDRPSQAFGDGGTIPFLKELEVKFPKTRIIALGVLGPGANAHSKNECLNLPYVNKLICVVSDVFQGLG